MKEGEPMGYVRRFLEDVQNRAIQDTQARLRMLDEHLAAKLKRMEGRIMAAIDDKLAELEAAMDAAHEAIANEIDQLAKAIAAQAPDLTPQVNRLAALVDRVRTDTDALRSDDPVVEAPPAPPAE